MVKFLRKLKRKVLKEYLFINYSFKNKQFILSLGSRKFNVVDSIKQDEEYEPWVVNYLSVASEFYGADKDAIDVGANIGFMSIILSQLQNKGKVYAFEPLDVMVKHLNKNIRTNSISNISVSKTIVSDKDDELNDVCIPEFGGYVGGSFVTKSGEKRESGYSEKVKTITLDTFFKNITDKQPNIKILKIDVECWEKQVILGAKETIQKHQPVAIIEFNVANRHLDIEYRAYELYQELISLFKYIFLIDRLSSKLIPISSYAELRGAILTGHFVEDLLCFNDDNFASHIALSVIDKQYTAYHSAKLVSDQNEGYVTLQHYPDSWTHAHNFFLKPLPEAKNELSISLRNKGVHDHLTVLISLDNEIQELTLIKDADSYRFNFNPRINKALHIYVDQVFDARDYLNPNDPRTLGIQVEVETVHGDHSTIEHQPTIQNPIHVLVEQLSKHPLKVLWKKNYWVEYNELFDVFYSFCYVNDRFISLHGEMNIETFHKRREKDSKVANLYKCEYQLSENGLEQINKKHIGLGADPRMVSDGKNAYAYVTGYGEAKHPAFIYREKDDSLHPVKADNDFDWGKNWQPFMKGERLFIVHELTPLGIYEINLTTFELQATQSQESDYHLPAHNTNHTMFRGGANAIYENGYTYGLARASAQSYKHLPFFWSSMHEKTPSLQFEDTFNGIAQKGFSIMDPTSFFKKGKEIFFGLACSETCWFHAQEILNVLLVLDPENNYTSLPYLSDVLKNYTDAYKGKEINLSNHIFHCDRLQHDIPHSYEYGVQSHGDAGVLVYGPYIEVKKAMQLQVELSYLTINTEGEKAGLFDICLSKKDKKGNVQFSVVGEHELKTTNKEMHRVSITFDTSTFLGWQAEFRVHVDQGYIVNAFHIRTKEL